MIKSMKYIFIDMIEKQKYSMNVDDIKEESK